MLKIKEKFLLNIAFPLADIVMGTCAMKWYWQIKLLKLDSETVALQIKCIYKDILNC